MRRGIGGDGAWREGAYFLCCGDVGDAKGVLGDGVVVVVVVRGVGVEEGHDGDGEDGGLCKQRPPRFAYMNSSNLIAGPQQQSRPS